MNLNKLVHETRGLCWHESDVDICQKCLKNYGPPKPDYENDMNACLELWEEGDLIEMRRFPNGVWRVWKKSCYRSVGQASTPQLAILRAYLKSKGVEVPKGDD